MNRLCSQPTLYLMAFLMTFGWVQSVLSQGRSVYSQAYPLSDSERERLRGDLEQFSQQQPQYDAIQKHRKRLRERARKRFKTADTDGNGFLNRDEFARMRPNAARHFYEIDQNYDGELSEQEVAQFIRQRMRERHPHYKQREPNLYGPGSWKAPRYPAIRYQNELR